VAARASGITIAPGGAALLVCLNITAREARMSKASRRSFLLKFGLRNNGVLPWHYHQDPPRNRGRPVLADFMLYSFNHWRHVQAAFGERLRTDQTQTNVFNI
jgi:hypothetical protein